MPTAPVVRRAGRGTGSEAGAGSACGGDDSAGDIRADHGIRAVVLAPTPVEPERQLGVLSRFKRWLVGDPTPEMPAAAPAAATTSSSSSTSSSGSGSSHARRERNDRDRGGHRRDRDGRRGERPVAPDGGDSTRQRGRCGSLPKPVARAKPSETAIGIAIGARAVAAERGAPTGAVAIAIAHAARARAIVEAADVSVEGARGA